MWKLFQLVNKLLCCPVLNPQMTGDPMLPGLVTVKVSEVQSPTDPPGNKKKKDEETMSR